MFILCGWMQWRREMMKDERDKVKEEQAERVNWVAEGESSMRWGKKQRKDEVNIFELQRM